MTTTKTVQSGRWNDADYKRPKRPRIIYRSHGLQKTGKTRFGLTGPQPVFVQGMDPGGLEGVVEPLLDEGRDIRVLEYDFNPQDYDNDANAAKAGNQLLTQYLTDYREALNQSGTLIWDETEFWRLLRWGRLGQESDRPSSFSALNDEYKSLIYKAYGAGVSFGLIQKYKEKWVSKFDPSKGKMVAHNTGDMEPVGMKELGYLVQVNLRHSRSGSTFSVTLEDVRQNGGVIALGMEFENADFATIGQAIFPETNETDWV